MLTSCKKKTYNKQKNLRIDLYLCTAIVETNSQLGSIVRVLQTVDTFSRWWEFVCSGFNQLRVMIWNLFVYKQNKF